MQSVIEEALVESQDDHRPKAWARKLVIVAMAVSVLAVLPFLLSGFWLRVATNVLMFAALAQSVNIIAGWAGRADFGNLVFFGLGAYTTGHLVSSGVTPPLAIAAGSAGCALFALLIGRPVLRLRGHYFAILSLGIMEGTRELVANSSILGGGGGMNVPTAALDARTYGLVFYFAMGGLMLAITLLVWVMSRSSLGYALRTVRADEEAAGTLGVNTTMAKTQAWALSAACTAAVGGVFALWVGFFEPANVFNVVTAVEVFVMMMLGGAGTIIGPLVGATTLHMAEVLVWSRFFSGHLIVLGLVVIGVVIYLPGGMVNAIAGSGMGRKLRSMRGRQ